MFRSVSPTVAIITLVIVLILYWLSKMRTSLRRAERTRQRVVNARKAEEPRKREYAVRKSTMQEIADEHAGYTAEIVNMLVPRKAEEMASGMQIGEPLKLKLTPQEDVVAYDVCGKRFCELVIDSDSRIPEAIKGECPLDAYLGGRGPLGDRTTVSIIVFYKMAGVAPTKVNIE